jgi:fatty acid-binding protein DegV
MSQPSFAVVTDSSAHLISPEWLHAPELGFVPLPVQIGTEIYHESSTLRLRDFFWGTTTTTAHHALTA